MSADTKFTDAERFFSALYAGQTGVLELRTFGPDKGADTKKAEAQRSAANKLRSFVPVENGVFDFAPVAKFLKGCEKAELGAFYGVALRSNKAMIDKAGGAAYCQVLTALFVDADFKHLGEETTRKRIAEFEEHPSMIVCSGAGLHPYWVLEQPFVLQMPGQYEDAKYTLKRFAHLVADVVDEQVSEPARVLRIPGSMNFKYDPPRPVVLEHFDTSDVVKRAVPQEYPPLQTSEGVEVLPMLDDPDTFDIDDFVVE